MMQAMKKITKKVTILLLSAIIFFQTEELYSDFQNLSAYHSIVPYSLDPNGDDVHTKF